MYQFNFDLNRYYLKLIQKILINKQ